MKKLILSFAFSLLGLALQAQNTTIDKTKVQEDLNQILNDINNLYVYLDEKKVDMECITQKYTAKIDGLKNEADVILLFEYLLNEFYDSHISLTTNIRESYRLYAPIYVAFDEDKAIIKNVWQTQLANLENDILGAEIVQFNGGDFSKAIEEFPALCSDKTSLEVRNWIANKVLSGKYSEPRILSLKLENGEKLEFDIDRLTFKNENELLTVQETDDIGIIRINNSLGNNQLITAFDKALDQLLDTKALIIDLRNTNNGGNTYVAKGIMGRFINMELPYQKHHFIESFDGQPKIVRSWFELVSPRGKQYNKPVVVLVGRWTGSMGEGMAVGFDALKRAEIVGTEMKRLAGSDFDIRINNQRFGYKLILEKLYHVDGTPREKYVPKHYVKQTSIAKDETLEKGIELLDKVM
ncbi:S41 family peptidase [Croceivirga thetidis]|uniref:Tail specific protease domain-containing protein n=1 Tax=Croceivirga thetidis TaxID=2721623 RepID=A0ABX1GV05_9FLAO|nr:S41 family peptidase [Croceivirga thetidis]NKI33468.1 hypothetical protein [Croceivirga thetidis]